eukprot:6178215-Pleurochrysis_carterae.AAC.2
MPPFSASGTQQSVVPSSLPFLPGNGFKDPTQTNFHKKQIFDVKGGIPTVREPAPRNSPPPANASFSAASYGGKGAMMDSVVSKGAAPADDTKAVPAWVAFDRKVLRFNCYFKESVHESRLENYRIRNCVLYYYLEDDSMHISEPKIENSGIPQALAHTHTHTQKNTDARAHGNGEVQCVGARTLARTKKRQAPVHTVTRERIERVREEE